MLDRLEAGFEESARKILSLPRAGVEPGGCTHAGAAFTTPWWEPLPRRWRRGWRCPACLHSWHESLPTAPTIRVGPHA